MREDSTLVIRREPIKSGVPDYWLIEDHFNGRSWRSWEAKSSHGHHITAIEYSHPSKHGGRFDYNAFEHLYEYVESVGGKVYGFKPGRKSGVVPKAIKDGIQTLEKDIATATVLAQKAKQELENKRSNPLPGSQWLLDGQTVTFLRHEPHCYLTVLCEGKERTLHFWNWCSATPID